MGFDLPVSVLSASFDSATPQRLQLRFDQSVAATLTTSDLQLQTVPGGLVVSPASMALAYDPALNLATVTFPGHAGGNLAGGLYRLTLAAGAVADPAGNPLVPSFIFDFNSNDGDGDGLLDSWELLYWPTTTGHAAGDDFDFDGVPELLELAFGLNPTLPDAMLQPAVVNEGGYLTISFQRRPGANYEVQSAGTLLPSQPDSFTAATTTILINEATTLKVRDNILIGTPPARFLRVKVTAAP